MKHVILILAVVSCSSVLWAQPADRCQSMPAAMALQNQQRYLDAAHCFERIHANTSANRYFYRLSALFNVGRAYQLAGATQHGVAITTFDRWLAERAAVPGSSLNASDLSNLTMMENLVRQSLAELRATTQPAPVSPPVVEPARPVVETPPPTPPPVTPPSTVTVGTRPPVTPHIITPEARASRRIFPAGPAVLWGLGALALGFGVWSGIVAEQYRGEVQDARVWTPEVESTYYGIDNARVGMGVSLGLGAVLVGAGALWYALGNWSRTETSRPSVSPVLGQNRLGFQFAF